MHTNRRIPHTYAAMRRGAHRQMSATGVRGSDEECAERKARAACAVKSVSSYPTKGHFCTYRVREGARLPSSQTYHRRSASLRENNRQDRAQFPFPIESGMREATANEGDEQGETTQVSAPIVIDGHTAGALANRKDAPLTSEQDGGARLRTRLARNKKPRTNSVCNEQKGNTGVFAVQLRRDLCLVLQGNLFLARSVRTARHVPFVTM